MTTEKLTAKLSDGREYEVASEWHAKEDGYIFASNFADEVADDGIVCHSDIFERLMLRAFLAGAEWGKQWERYCAEQRSRIDGMLDEITIERVKVEIAAGETESK